MKHEIVIQGRGGYIKIGNYKFDIEIQTDGADHCIYFPNRKLDKSLVKAKQVIQTLIDSNPGKWELAEYDTLHGFYDAMTVNERLSEARLLDEFDAAITSKDKKLLKEILTEVEVPNESIEAILTNA